MRGKGIWAVSLPWLIALALVASAGLGVAGSAEASGHHHHRWGYKHQHRQSRKQTRQKKVHIVRGGRGGVSLVDDYPAQWKNAPQDSLLDNWREYNRECTSFVAFRLDSRAGFRMPFYDDAINWGPRARALGYTVDQTPAIGSVAWTSAHGGHVAWVADVQGTNIVIEQYNADFHGHYSNATVPASTFQGFIHFNDQTPSSDTGSGGADPTNPQGGNTNPQGPTTNPQGPTTNPQGPTTNPQGPSPGTGGGDPRSIQIGWSSSHAGWIWMTVNGYPTGPHQYTCSFASGGNQTFTLQETSSPQTWDNGHTCYDLEHGDTVWVNIEGVDSNKITVP